MSLPKAKMPVILRSPLKADDEESDFSDFSDPSVGFSSLRMTDYFGFASVRMTHRSGSIPSENVLDSGSRNDGLFGFPI
jgi:hypothetical protein